VYGMAMSCPTYPATAMSIMKKITKITIDMTNST